MKANISVVILCVLIIISCTQKKSSREDWTYLSYQPTSKIDTSKFKKTIITGHILSDNKRLNDKIFIKCLNFAFPYQVCCDTTIELNNNSFVYELTLNHSQALLLSFRDFDENVYNAITLLAKSDAYNYYLCAKHYLGMIDLLIEPGDSLNLEINAENYTPYQRLDVEISSRLSTKPDFLKDF